MTVLHNRIETSRGAMEKDCSLLREKHTAIVLIIAVVTSLCLLAITSDARLADTILLSFYYPIDSLGIIIISGFLFLSFVLIFLWTGHYTVDWIFIFLALRIPFLLIPLIYTNRLNGYWGNYASVIVAASTYIISRSLDVNREKLIRIVSVIGVIIISLQLVSNLVSIVNSSGIQGYVKWHIAIPSGDSNRIAMELLLFTPVALVSLKRNTYKVGLLILSSIAILLTLSNSALIIWILLMIVVYPKYYQLGHNKLLSIIALLSSSVAIGYAVLTLNNYGLLDRFIARFSSIGELSLNELSSGRVDLFKYSLNDSMKHPLFGVGLGYPLTSNSKLELRSPHNIFLEAFRQGGMLNVIVFFGAVISSIHKLRYNVLKNRNLKGILIASLAVLLHGMVEPGLFGYDMSFFFWLFIGFGVANFDEKPY